MTLIQFRTTSKQGEPWLVEIDGPATIEKAASFLGLDENQKSAMRRAWVSADKAGISMPRFAPGSTSIYNRLSIEVLQS